MKYLPTSPKYLGLAFLLPLLLLGGCRNSILHKDGATDVAHEVTDPLIKALDEQTDKLIYELRLDELTFELKKLVQSTTESVESGKITIEQLAETLNQITIMAENINRLVDNANLLVENVNEVVEDSQEVEAPLYVRVLPSAVIVLAILFAALIIIRSIKKKD